MAKAKKITAALTAALLCTASLTSCSDTSYVMTVGDSKINAGIYIYNELTEMSYQMTMMYYQKGIKKDYFDQKVDGKAFDEYLSDYALTATKEYAAVVDKFNELGLTLSDEDIKSINDSISSTWDSQGEFYESEGISKESVKLALKGSKMREELFDHYYAEGGEEAVSDDEMVKYLDDNYLRYKSISFAKTKASTDSSSSATDSSTRRPQIQAPPLTAIHQPQTVQQRQTTHLPYQTSTQVLQLPTIHLLYLTAQQNQAQQRQTQILPQTVLLLHLTRMQMKR